MTKVTVRILLLHGSKDRFMEERKYGNPEDEEISERGRQRKGIAEREKEGERVKKGGSKEPRVI